MDPNAAFPSADNSSKELFEKQQRELNKYATRYLYAPFQTVACPQVPGGVIPAGAIYAMPAPKGKVNAALLPDGAQILELVAPAPDAPKSVAVYLFETEPIVQGIANLYGREGVVEIKALFGMSEVAFEEHRINALLFGSEPPTTASAIAARMAAVIDQAGKQSTPAAQVLARVAREVFLSAQACAQMCSEHVRERHLQMDDPNHDGPKRYSRRDLRAIEFIGAVRREQYLQHVAEQQQQAMTAIPQMLQVMQEQHRQSAEMMGQMAAVLKELPDALKAVASAGGESKKK